jgi:hypothetical protein
VFPFLFFLSFFFACFLLSTPHKDPHRFCLCRSLVSHSAFAQSLLHSLTHSSLTHSLIHEFTHSFTHSLIHSLIYLHLTTRRPACRLQ